MQWTVIGGCLAALLVLTTTNSVHEPNVKAAECNHTNSQKSLYGHPKYSPKLTDSPVTRAYTAVKGLQVEPLRQQANNGIYASTMMYTRQKNGDNGCGGYFGVVWKGNPDLNDTLLFSIWDKKGKGGKVTSYALPMHDATCERNCNDCSGDSNGSQCKFQLPKLQEGDELMLTVEREAVESSEYKNVTYKGHVWKVTAVFSGDAKGEVITIGRILFTDDLEIGEKSNGGIIDMSFFDEHIGCTLCNTFTFESKRTGPYVTETAGNKTLPELQEFYASFGCNWSTLGNCTCRAFDVTSGEFGSVKFVTGAKGIFPHWDVKKWGKIY